MNKIFESENICFVEVCEELIGDYLRMVNDNEHVNRYIGNGNKTYTEEQEKDWVREKIEEKAVVFSMIEKKSGRFIGNIELMDSSGSARELGIAITSKMQEKGFGTEAIKAMISYGFEKLGLERIVLRTKIFNSRAIHVYGKCGFMEYDRDDERIYMEICR